jgi:hypothetical protein
MTIFQFVIRAFAAFGLIAFVAFMLVVVVIISQNLIMLWGSVKKYGGEKPRNLNWFGRLAQRLFQFLQGKTSKDIRGYHPPAQLD